MNAWKVQLNDCDCEFVLADTEGVAVSLALLDAYKFSGMPVDEVLGDDGIVSARRRENLDGVNLTLRQLIETGDCVPNESLSDDDLDSLHRCIFISTEF